jgi:ATP-dependent Clp endopeptidase proteolytic subunit ClpP
MKTWYAISAKKADAPEITVHDAIGAFGVSGAAFDRDVKALGKVSEITVSINSPGGSLFDALAMYHSLRASGAKVTTKVVGIAASAASVVFMAGDKRVMPENTLLMVHNCMGPLMGNADEHRAFGEVLDKINTSIVTTYVARTGKSEDEVRALLDNETFLTATEAKAAGFADEVLPSLRVSASFDIEQLPAEVKALFAPEVDNTPESTPAPTPAPVALTVDQLVAAAKEMGLEEFSADWAVSNSFTTLGEMNAVLTQAREVKALCALVKKPDAAAGFIRASTPLVDVRAQLAQALAEKDEAAPIDTSIKNSNSPVQAAQPTAVTTAGIWAARKLAIGSH